MYGELGWLRRIQWSVLNLLYSNSGCSDKAAGDLTSDHSRDITILRFDILSFDILSFDILPRNRFITVGQYETGQTLTDRIITNNGLILMIFGTLILTNILHQQMKFQLSVSNSWEAWRR